MVISIQDNLLTVKNYLIMRGYNVVNMSDDLSSDTYIFSQSNMKLHSFESSIHPCAEGALLINADNMSLSEIENAVNYRTYTPLFHKSL